MSTTAKTEAERVGTAKFQTALAIDPSLPRAEQVARIRAALETLRDIGED